MTCCGQWVRLECSLLCSGDVRVPGKPPKPNDGYDVPSTREDDHRYFGQFLFCNFSRGEVIIPKKWWF